jgi:hypothetical protein
MLGRFAEARSDLKHRSATKLRKPSRTVAAHPNPLIEYPRPATWAWLWRASPPVGPLSGRGRRSRRVDASVRGSPARYWILPLPRGNDGAGPCAGRCPLRPGATLLCHALSLAVGSSLPRPQVTPAMPSHRGGVLLENDIILPSPPADLAASSMTWGSSCLRVTLLPNPTRSSSQARPRLGPLPQQ